MSLINIQKEKDCLLISLNEDGKKEIQDIIKNKHDYFGKWLDLTEYEMCNGVFDFVHPEKIGALTDAPIIAFNVYYDDDGNLQEHEDAEYYWFADYMVTDEFYLLKQNKQVKFIKAG